MSKHIALRRVFEITLRIVSILFALEILFSVMYAFSVNPQANGVFRQMILGFQNILGIAVTVLDAILIIISIFLLFMDGIFPLGGFLVALAELAVSVVITILSETVELAVFKGMEVLI